MFKHDLQIEARLTDDFEHVGGRGLLLLRLLQLAGEPRDICLLKPRMNRPGDSFGGAAALGLQRALRGRALAGLPPALEGLFIASTHMAGNEAS